jgi:hypothetical protein
MSAAMNSRKHAKLRRLQTNRKCRKIIWRLGNFILEKSPQMISAAQEDLILYGRTGAVTLDEDGLLSYWRVEPLF